MDILPKKESRNIVMRKFDELVGWEDKSKQIETFLKTENYYRVKPNNVRALKEALTLGPVALSLRAENSATWAFYTKGIIDDEDCGIDINHAVIGVGYGIEKSKNPDTPDKEYVIIKNSWGTGWGENGYVKVSLS